MRLCLGRRCRSFAVFAPLRHSSGYALLCTAAFGVPRRIPHRRSEIGAAVHVHLYDEYRRGKGFAPVTFQTENGQAHVPGIVLLKSLNEEELDLCDTRTARARSPSARTTSSPTCRSTSGCCSEL